MGIAIVSVTAYGAYAYFKPKYVEYQAARKAEQLARELQEEQQNTAADEEGQQKEIQEESENTATDAKTTKDVSDAQQAAKKQAALNRKFKINADAVEDYAAVLDPDTYSYYDSGISEFAFFYPAEMFHRVTYSEKPKEKAYGTNLQTIDFTASKGSELKFALYQRTDQLSMEQMTNYIYEREFNSMQDSIKLIFSAEEDHGRVIVTGYTDARDKLIYDMVKIEPSYVMHMKLYFPQYTGSEDKLQKGYVTECIYRMCGFSGSTNRPRSYQEYKEGN